MKPKLLIFGGTGFVGKNFNKIFFDKYQIINTGSEVDVSDIEVVKNHLSKYNPHYVINLASITTLREVDDNVTRAYDVIYNGNRNILKSLNCLNNIRSYLYVSSSEVYDSNAYDEQFMLTESSKVSPSSSNYASLKLLSENFCLNFKSNFCINIARPFTHIGPYQSFRFGYSKIINDLVQLKKTKQHLSIFMNNLDSFRDITNVEDICKGYEMLIKSKFNKEIFNFCTSNQVFMHSFIRICEEVFDEQIIINSGSEISKNKNNYYRKNIGSYNKALKLLNWMPSKTLQETVMDMMIYCKND